MSKLKFSKELSVVDTITFLLTLSVIVYTIFQDKKIRNLEYKDRAIETKPILELIGQPKLIVDSMTINAQFIDHRILRDTLKTKTDIKVCEIVKFKNVGNEKATILLEVSSDTLVRGKYLRDILSDKEMFLQKGRIAKNENFFIEKELLPGDTLIHEENTALPVGGDREYYVRHLLILYDNSYNNRYDTYLRYRYKINQPIWEPRFQPDGSLYVKFLKSYFEIFTLEESPNRITKIYTKKEKKKQDKLIFEEVTKLRNINQ